MKFEYTIWFLEQLENDEIDFVIPEIVDYELRRELIRINSKSIRRLDELAEILIYLPLTSDDFKKAAQLWAAARNANQPTAHRHALDGDVLLAAQAIRAGGIVWTENLKDLLRYVPAKNFEQLKNFKF